MGLQIRQKLSSLGPLLAIDAPSPTGSKLAVRWNTVNWRACRAISGMACTPDEPVPSTATRWPLKSTAACGQRAAWCTGPANVARPGRSGLLGVDNRPQAITRKRATCGAPPSTLTTPVLAGHFVRRTTRRGSGRTRGGRQAHARAHGRTGGPRVNASQRRGASVTPAPGAQGQHWVLGRTPCRPPRFGDRHDPLHPPACARCG